MGKNTPDDGGPAFPTNAESWQQGFAGMTLRDYLAAHVSVSEEADYPTGVSWQELCVAIGQPKETPSTGWEGSAVRVLFEAITRYRKADAMITARKVFS